MMEDRGHDGYRGDLNDRCRTIAEVLTGRLFQLRGRQVASLPKKVFPKTDADRHNVLSAQLHPIFSEYRRVGKFSGRA